MKKLLSLVSLMILAGVLAACSSSPSTSAPPTSTPPASYGEAVRTFEGQVSGYQSGEAVLKAYRLDSPAPDKLVGEGKINADGSFSFEFNKVVDTSGIGSFLCEEDPIGSDKAVPSVGVNRFFIQASGGDGFYDTVGFLVLANSDWPKKSQASSGDKQIFWDYVKEDTVVKRTCENGSEFDVSLRAGWNTSVVAYESSDTGSMTSLGITGDFSWYVLPYPNR